MSRKEPGHPDLNRREKHLLEMLMVAAKELDDGRDILRDRIYLADPAAFRYLTCALGLIRKLEGVIMDTMPQRQLLQLKVMCDAGVISFNIDRTLLPNGYQAISDADANVLAACAANQTCSLCLLDEAASRNCELRKVLTRLWPPKEIPKHRCPYLDRKWRDDPTAVVEGEDE